LFRLLNLTIRWVWPVDRGCLLLFGTWFHLLYVHPDVQVCSVIWFVNLMTCVLVTYCPVHAWHERSSIASSQVFLASSGKRRWNIYNEDVYAKWLLACYILLLLITFCSYCDVTMQLWMRNHKSRSMMSTYAF
jgi:hypothetical protein